MLCTVVHSLVQEGKDHTLEKSNQRWQHLEYLTYEERLIGLELFDLEKRELRRNHINI